MATTCLRTDIIKCTHCNAVYVVANLRREEGHKFPIPWHSGHCWHSGYYYCYCDDPLPKAFDWGDGSPFELVSNVELVSLRESA